MNLWNSEKLMEAWCMIDGCKASDGGNFIMVMEDGSKKWKTRR